MGLSLFAGGVANAIYAANNAETIDDISNTCDQSTDINTDFCNAFKRVRDSEAAAAVSREIYICDRICENMHSSHIQFFKFEDS